jgi:hypothetical protein
MISPEKMNYSGWLNSYRLSNGKIELVVTTDVGPRIIRFGLVKQDNMMCEMPGMIGKTGGDEWRIYGGHRLWHAPEHPERTYYPDNSPVRLEEHSGFVRIVQPVEPTTGIRKEIDIMMDERENHVKLTHRLVNRNLWQVDLAVWALSVMAPGGKVIIPLPPRGSHPKDLLPANTMTFWSYTNMADPRWYWGEKYVMLRQDSDASQPQKVGFEVPAGWAAYARAGCLFLKKFAYVPGAEYPDHGCNMETFTNADMLEVESLGPITKLQPGASVEHVEDWYLFGDVLMPKNGEEVDRLILPRINTVISR